MVIEECGWRIEPYKTNGKRCWQLTRMGRKTPERYYDDLGRALRFVVEYAIRNDRARPLRATGRAHRGSWEDDSMSDYTPITGELRKYATVSWDPWPDARDRLYQMCDRIDAVHAGLEREYAATLAEREGDWIKLPVDADGLPIHIGDAMVLRQSDKPVIVEGIGVSTFFGLTSYGYDFHTACRFEHHHTPTVEDVLREFALKVAGEECMTMRTGVVEEYAAKLQLAGDAS